MYNREILNAIWKLPDMKRPLKLTFLTYASYARADGSEIWPGEEVVARDLICSDRQIRRDVSSLLADGWLLTDGYVGHTKRYKINMRKLGLAEVTLPAKRIKGKVTLETPPADAPAPGRSVDLRIKQKIISYIHLEKAGSSHAEFSRPTRNELREFIWDYRAMVNRVDPAASQHELAAMYAEEILQKENIVV